MITPMSRASLLGAPCGALLFVALLGAATPVHAANKDMERLQIQVASLQGQVSDLTRLIEDQAKELRRLNELLADHGALLRKHGQDERAGQESLQSSVREWGERLSSLDERLQQQAAVLAALQRAASEAAQAGLPAGNPSLPPGTVGSQPPPSTGGAPPPAPRELYSQAYADYARGNYDLAVQGFQEYLRGAPGSDLADNAQYWIGECHYGKQRFNDAIDAWNALLRDFPSSDKLPDARVKKGMALERLGRRSQALIEYRFVVDRYPNSSAARIARDKLNPN
jgi:tol-pal system protein YbgF